jgi:hypothetical protein
MSLEGNAGLKVNRIKSQNAASLGLLGAAIPEALGRVAKLGETRRNVVELRAVRQTMSTFGLYCRADGFDPTRTFQHIANVDNEIWQVILGMFAKYNEETGDFMDDGLLYKYDSHAGCVKLNKDFFFALIDFLEASGYPCDMRGKIKVV